MMIVFTLTWTILLMHRALCSIFDPTIGSAPAEKVNSYVDITRNVDALRKVQNYQHNSISILYNSDPPPLGFHIPRKCYLFNDLDAILALDYFFHALRAQVLHCFLNS